MSQVSGRSERRGARLWALTHIELVMILTTIGLGGAVVLPSLNNASKSRDEAQCLNNLRQIAAASWQYSMEDPHDQLVPLHKSVVRISSSSGFLNDPGGSPWSYAARPYSFGGQTPTVPFPGGCGNTMMSPAEGGNGYWLTETRPLDKYVDAGGDGGIGTDPQVMEVFHCPADAGFPNDPNGITDCPADAFGIPLYDMLGSSYRVNTTGLRWLPENGSFTSAPWGHRASSIDGLLPQTVLYVEPLFSSYLLQSNGGQPLEFWGWHRQFMSDQIAYCDGSARMTRMDPLYQFSQQELTAMGYNGAFAPFNFLRRGPTWRMDMYPTPGSHVRMYADDGHAVPPVPSYAGWPFDGYQTIPVPD